MKIINSGNDTTTYRFHCAKCGCVYEAVEWELQYSGELAFPRFRYTHCPRCNTQIPVDYAELLSSTDTLAETVNEKESKSESTENCCENCAYLGTRKDDSHFCIIPGKTPSTVTCDRYKNIETYKAEHAERTKLREAAQYLKQYCKNTHACAGCPFARDGVRDCILEQVPDRWNTDF